MSEHAELDMIDEYALGTLDAASAARVAAHLRHCAACRAEYASTRAVLDVLPHSLEERPAGAALLGKIEAAISAPATPRDFVPPANASAFAHPLARALAAGLVLALAGDAWLLVRAARTPSVPAVRTVATRPAPPSLPTPATAVAPVTASAPQTPAPATATPAGESEALREIARLDAELSAERRRAAGRDARSEAKIARLEAALAGARAATRVVYVTPAPQPASPQPQVTDVARATPGATQGAELVAALRTGRVFALDGTVGSEAWHLTIVQPPGKSNALIFSGTPHAPQGQVYRTWVVRAGKTYDAGPLAPGEPETLEMPMPLETGDVVAFSREPASTGDHPTQPFLMQVTIAE